MIVKNTNQIWAISVICEEMLKLVMSELVLGNSRENIPV